MNLDPDNWDPLPVDELAGIFHQIPIPWWIAGGVALDLFVGRTTRPHDDIDVLVLRRDQLVVQEHLRDWHLFKTQAPAWPHLAPWPRGELLDLPVCDIWARRELCDGPWRFQIMLMEAEGDRWVYRRLRSIGGRISDLGLVSEAGIPYLRPEIQLLYKSPTGRPKDTRDLMEVLPHLPREGAERLLHHLREQDPEGHPWIPAIEERLRATR